MRVAPGHFPGNGGFFMRGVGKKLAAVLALACAAFGAQSVPGAVLDARQSTVRIVAISGENAFYGTGFTVARNSCYVVTNYHVIEGCSEFEIYLSHDAAVPATVKATAPGADLAVLETAAPLKVPGLALRTSSFDTGLAVWALGFPGGADILTGQEAAGVDEMTVTDGIVSAIKTSRVVGTASQDVQLVQTNTAINQGNSGGPMLDEHGNVVGVNTVGVDGAQNINGAVHVVELINVLEANGIPYKTQSRMGVVLGVAALALCAAGAVLGVFMWKKKGRPRGTGQRAVPLVQFVQAGRRLAPAEAAAAVAAALQGKGAQAHSLCAPQCVQVRGNGIELVKKNGADYRAPGYTAPEIYYGVQSEAGSVYFYGAVLYALTEGAVPPDIPARMNGAPLAPGEQNPLRFFVENAMDMQAGRRTQSLAQFAAELAGLATRLAAAQTAAPAADAPHPAAAAESREMPPCAAAAQAAQGPAQPAPQPKKCRLRRRVVAAVVVLAVLAVPAGFGIYTWRQAGALETAISYGQYGRAQAVYRRAPWLSMLDEQQAAYVDAQVLMEQGELEQARQAFLVLEGYQDSEELAENIRLYLIAVDHPKSLGALKQYEYFIELGDFLDSHSRALECLPGIAEEGVSWFEDWRFERAKEAFTILSQYEGNEIAQMYLVACELGQEFSEQYIDNDLVRYTSDQMATMRGLDDYIDISPLIYYDMRAYLYGDWYSSSGNYMWFSDDVFGSSFYIPSATYYFYEDGMVHTGNEQYYATWEYVNFDTLYVTVNGRSEYYYRTV